MIFFYHRDGLRRANQRLLQLLSDAVKTAAATEDTINNQLGTLIEETSQQESGLASGTAHEGSSAAMVTSLEGWRNGVPHPLPPGAFTSTPAVGLMHQGNLLFICCIIAMSVQISITKKSRLS